jgi:hypothetical protein
MIAREFRNQFLDRTTLRGYYFLAKYIVPVIKKNQMLRVFVKKQFVDRWIRYGKHAIGMNVSKPTICETIATKLFLGVCKIVGTVKRRVVRSNGEVW